jgi:CheY-like chemotaxis protein
LPRVSNPEESADLPQNLPANGKKIILAEDDPFISRMYQTKLSSGGYDVQLVNNGRDAFEAIKDAGADLVMMDLNMPELTGFEVMRALQSGGFNFSRTIFVILTNSANPADRAEAKNFNADYLIKAELTPREVLEYINKRLGLSPGQ